MQLQLQKRSVARTNLLSPQHWHRGQFACATTDCTPQRTDTFWKIRRVQYHAPRYRELIFELDDDQLAFSEPDGLEE